MFVPLRRSRRRLLVLLASAVCLAVGATPARADVLVFGFAGSAPSALRGYHGTAASPTAHRGRRIEEAAEDTEAALTPLPPAAVLAVVLVVPAGTAASSSTASNMSSVTKAPGGSGTSSSSGTSGLVYPASIPGVLTESAPEPTSLMLALFGAGFGIVGFVLGRRRQARGSRHNQKPAAAPKDSPRAVGAKAPPRRRLGPARSDQTWPSTPRWRRSWPT